MMMKNKYYDIEKIKEYIYKPTTLQFIPYTKRYFTKSEISIICGILTKEKLLPCDLIHIGYNIQSDMDEIIIVKDKKQVNISICTKKKLDYDKLTKQLEYYFMQ